MIKKLHWPPCPGLVGSITCLTTVLACCPGILCETIWLITFCWTTRRCCNCGVAGLAVITGFVFWPCFSWPNNKTSSVFLLKYTNNIRIPWESLIRFSCWFEVLDRVGCCAIVYLTIFFTVGAIDSTAFGSDLTGVGLDVGGSFSIV